MKRSEPATPKKAKQSRFKKLPLHHVKKLRHPIRHIKDYRARKTNVTAKTVVPYITNETVAEHREEVLKGARKYVYPLQHSKHKIVVISSTIFITTVVALFAYGAVALYKIQSTSTFVYRISQVVPFPVARVKGHFVTYESYLFELRHYIHYYETQQKLSFSSPEGKLQLANYKKRALESVIDDAYVKQLAREKHVNVSNSEVDVEIATVKDQNRLGTSSQVFEDVLRDFWGWSLNDFKRSLRNQILARKVVSKLDTDAHARADASAKAIKAGVAFGDVAKQYSDDAASKNTNGDYAGLIDKSNRDISPKVTAAMFKLKAGEVSGIIDTGYSLEIIRLDAYENGKARAGHIQINFKDLSKFLDPLKTKYKARKYIKV